MCIEDIADAGREAKDLGRPRDAHSNPGADCRKLVTAAVEKLAIGTFRLYPVTLQLRAGIAELQSNYAVFPVDQLNVTESRSRRVGFAQPFTDCQGNCLPCPKAAVTEYYLLAVGPAGLAPLAIPGKPATQTESGQRRSTGEHSPI
jgi:hypothetical protein